MSRLTIVKSRDLVCVERNVLENPNLSYTSKGLWAYLCSMSENEIKFTREEFLHKDENEWVMIQDALTELSEFGYITVQEV